MSTWTPQWACGRTAETKPYQALPCNPRAICKPKHPGGRCFKMLVGPLLNFHAAYELLLLDRPQLSALGVDRSQQQACLLPRWSQWLLPDQVHPAAYPPKAGTEWI